MKNIIIITFFGCIVYVANLFIPERKVIAIVEAQPVQSQQLILRENKRRVLMNELKILVNKNSDTIDSLKNSN